MSLGEPLATQVKGMAFEVSQEQSDWILNPSVYPRHGPHGYQFRFLAKDEEDSKPLYNRC